MLIRLFPDYYVDEAEVYAILPYGNAYTKKMLKTYKSDSDGNPTFNAIDASNGKAVKTLILLRNNKIIYTNLAPSTIASKFEKQRSNKV